MDVILCASKVDFIDNFKHTRVYNRSRWPFADISGQVDWTFFVQMSSKDIFLCVLCIMRPLSRRSNVVLFPNTLGSNDDITIQTSNWRAASNPLVPVPRYGLVKHNTPGHVTHINQAKSADPIRHRMIRRLIRICTVCSIKI